MRHNFNRWQASWIVALVLLIPGLATAKDKPLPNNRIGIPTAPVLLLSRPEVVADLGLTTEQILKAEQAISRLYLKAAALVGKSGPAVLAARKQVDTEQVEWLEENLTERQRERLFQVELQWEGASALVNRPILSEALRLTPEQKNLLSLAKKKRDDARKAGSGSLRAIEAEWSKEALTILDDGQRDVWKSMLGHPLAFQLDEETAPATRPTAKK